MNTTSLIRTMGFLIVLFLMGCGRQTPLPATPLSVEIPKAPSTTPPSRDDATPEIPLSAGVVDSKGSVAIEVLPQYNSILQNAKGELNILLKLDGKEVANVERQPLDLAIVIDRSGSMVGEKISSVKVAALELLKRLREDDMVTLITYSDTVTVHNTRQILDETGVHSVRAEILNILAGGSTALGPATQKAEKILEQPHGDVPRLSHILLLSDGLANVGEKDPNVLGQVCANGFSKGVSLSTLGVGLDYNEDLMTRMADEGGGQYHFVKEDSAIASVVEGELKGLMATVAREIILEIAPAAGIEIERVYGYPATEMENKTFIKIGSLRSGQNRDVVVSVSVASEAREEQPIANIEVKFKDTLNNNALETIALTSHVNTTSEVSRVNDSENTEVTVRVAEVKSSEELKIAAQAVDKGDFVQAETVLNQSILDLEVQSKATPDEKLEMQLSDLRKAKADLQMAKTSVAEKKNYVKQRKSTAYKKSKRTQKRTSTFDKITRSKKKSSTSKSRKPMPKKSKKSSDIYSY